MRSLEGAAAVSAALVSCITQSILPLLRQRNSRPWIAAVVLHVSLPLALRVCERCFLEPQPSGRIVFRAGAPVPPPPLPVTECGSICFGPGPHFHPLPSTTTGMFHSSGPGHLQGPPAPPPPPPPLLQLAAARNPPEDHSAAHGTETTPLLRRRSTDGGGADGQAGALIPQEATWQQEAKTIGVWSVPLIITYLLQRSIYMVSIFVMGRVGTTELGAVSGKYSRLARSFCRLACYAMPPETRCSRTMLTCPPRPPVASITTNMIGNTVIQGLANGTAGKPPPLLPGPFPWGEQHGISLMHA